MTISRWADDRLPTPNDTERLLAMEHLDEPETADEASALDGTAGDLDLEDRISMRRVAGLSTELADVSEVEYRQLRLERVVLVGVWTDGSAEDAENSLTELAALAETAGSQVLEGLVQRRSRPDPSTFVGSGKVGELRDVVLETGADTVICDGELSAAQLRNLEDKVKVKVVDRTALILDIFAQHAKSREGKTQVELAQLNYLVQRLRGWGENLSRQAGGRVKRSSKPTGGVSAPGWRSFAASSRTWRSLATPSEQSADGARCQRSSLPATPMPASPRCSTG
jgi:GTPase